MKSITINWKTSAAGAVSLLTGVAGLIQLLSSGAPLAQIISSPAAAEIITGVGLIFAKDGNVTGGTVVQPSA